MMGPPGEHDEPRSARRVQGECAVRLMELLGLTDDELCEVLDVDPLTLLSGQLDHRTELPILIDLLDESLRACRCRRAAALGPGQGAGWTADRRAAAAGLRRLRGCAGRAGRDGFVLRGGG